MTRHYRAGVRKGCVFKQGNVTICSLELKLDFRQRLTSLSGLLQQKMDHLSHCSFPSVRSVETSSSSRLNTFTDVKVSVTFVSN